MTDGHWMICEQLFIEQKNSVCNKWRMTDLGQLNEKGNLRGYIVASVNDIFFLPSS